MEGRCDPREPCGAPRTEMHCAKEEGDCETGTGARRRAEGERKRRRGGAERQSERKRPVCSEPVRKKKREGKGRGIKWKEC